ncbi:sensor domain-containing protein [Mycobacterium sherrisii]|uniref:PknH-like extracellular domain-containing protein n=1 Tax=Mycobacterium sherrisii TaxID=243061 RepID=A0A1E3T5P3_9MYCO|nr:sensor domain-containing protein [Mycobacterium sherrisii]MEC4762336.1 sensor domain-containing protein [Mycobacterium sherrisii]ODR09702.1 hypothetical protein BHQ21_03665 [Mycobacterium sherrisii]
MRIRWRSAAPLLVTVVAAGCASAIGGHAVPAPDLKPHPVIGQKVKQILLDAAALSKLLDRPFVPVSHFPPTFGGSELLDDAYFSTSPSECTGVVYMTQRSVYGSAPVTNVATALWQQQGYSESATDIAEGVVALPSAADAGALFAKFSEQWKHCDGTTLSVPASSFAQNLITDVTVQDSVVAANLSRQPGAQSVLHAVPEVRAVGVRGNCLIEVDVAYVNSADLSGRPAAKTDALTVAHALMDKVSALG